MKGTLHLNNYRRVFFVYTLLFAVFTSPYLFFGDVVSPYSQCLEFGYEKPCKDGDRIEHRGWTDHPSFYIPEVYQHLNGVRSGWIGLWTDKNELGRPLSHLTGFSSAYFPSWVLSNITQDPWRFITIFSLMTCYMGGLFLLLFARENDLAPLAGLTAASSFALSPTMMYWLIFPMYLSTWCWSAGVLWGLVRAIRRTDAVSWSVLSFSVYSLGLTGYPQYVVHHAYIIFGYGVIVLWEHRKLLGMDGARKVILLVSSSIIVGGLLTLPVLMDLAHVVSESNQRVKDISFFTMYLQGMNYWIDAARFFVFVVQPEIFGRFADDSYRYPSYGFYVTLLTLFFSLIAFFGTFKKTLWWWIVIILFVYLTFAFDAYEFGVRYLFFNLSPVLPISMIMLPLAIIVAFGANFLFQREIGVYRSSIVGLGLIGIFSAVTGALIYGYYFSHPIRWTPVVYSAIFIILCVGILFTKSPILLVVAISVVTFSVSYSAMFRQSGFNLLNSSPLVDAMRSELKDGGRYLVANPGYGLTLLPSNLNARLDLSSVHNSNSLASRRYQTWLEAMNDTKEWKGGRSWALSPTYDSSIFWMSDISLILSPEEITHENLYFVEAVQGVRLYRVRSRMGEALQVLLPSLDLSQSAIEILDLRAEVVSKPTIDRNLGDSIEVRLNTKGRSLLVLSQKYHKDWQAVVYRESGWTPADTTIVNGIFQGVLVPEGTEVVKIEFKPYVRYSWVGHLFWLLLLSVAVFNHFRFIIKIKSKKNWFQG